MTDDGAAASSAGYGTGCEARGDRRDEPRAGGGKQTRYRASHFINWPAAEWAVWLLPLLSGEAQTAALGLPVSARGSLQAVKKAVLDQILLPR